MSSYRPSTRGVLFITDLVDSTRSKYDFARSAWGEIVTRHNDFAIAACSGNDLPQLGHVISVQGDGVVASFDAEPGHERQALASGLMAAERMLESCRTWTSGQRKLRTKVTLHYYTDAFLYEWKEDQDDVDIEVIGRDIDVAFRVSAMAWRMQTLATDSFVTEVLRHSRCAAEPCGRGDVDLRRLLAEAAAKRDSATAEPDQRPWNIERKMSLQYGNDGEIGYWITDARYVKRLKGIPGGTSVCLLGFRHPAEIPADEREELRIKLRQDVHAVVMVDVNLERGTKDNYLTQVIRKLHGGRLEERMDSEVTLCVAAGVYGPYDFFFRVSCIDDQSLGRFFELIHKDSNYRVETIDVRQTIGDRFRVNTFTQHIIERYAPGGRMRGQLILSWFEKIPGEDLHKLFVGCMKQDEDGKHRRVHVLETGEVIHKTPVYALFCCETLSDYVQFFVDANISSSSCHSHVVQMDGIDQVHLRYGLVSGIYLPPLPADEDGLAPAPGAADRTAPVTGSQPAAEPTAAGVSRAADPTGNSTSGKSSDALRATLETEYVGFVKYVLRS